MPKINPLALSIIGGCFLILITYSLFWVLYFHAGSSNAVSAALNTLGGYFGGIATLWAAVVAACLFNDWKVQKKYELEKEYIEKFSSYIFEIYSLINSQSSQILYMFESYSNNKTFTVLKLDNVDFVDVSIKDKHAHHLVNLIKQIIPECNLANNYDDFQNYLSYLCLLNEKASKRYFLYFSDYSHDSPFLALHYEGHQMKPTEIFGYRRFIEAIEKPLTIKMNNQEQIISYAQLLEYFNGSFKNLNTEIIKYLKP